MRSLEIAVASTLFVVFVTMVGAAARYPREAGLVPLIVGIPATALAAWQLWREVAKHRRTLDQPADTGDRAFGTPTERRSLAWVALFALMVLTGGFVVGGTIAVMACQRFWLRESWRTSVVGGAIALFVSYFCFERGLGLTLFSGWIAAWARG